MRSDRRVRLSDRGPPDTGHRTGTARRRFPAGVATVAVVVCALLPVASGGLCGPAAGAADAGAADAAGGAAGVMVRGAGAVVVVVALTAIAAVAFVRRRRRAHRPPAAGAPDGADARLAAFGGVIPPSEILPETEDPWAIEVPARRPSARPVPTMEEAVRAERSMEANSRTVQYHWL